MSSAVATTSALSIVQQRTDAEDTSSVLQGLLEIVSAASEFDDLPVRPGEEESVRRLLTHAKMAVSKPVFHEVPTKVNALMQV